MIGGGCKCIMCDFLTCLRTIILTDWDNIAGISKTDISFVWELSLDWPICRVQISVQEWPCQSCLCCCIEGTPSGRFFRLRFFWLDYIAVLFISFYSESDRAICSSTIFLNIIIHCNGYYCLICVPRLSFFIISFSQAINIYQLSCDQIHDAGLLVYLV